MIDPTIVSVTSPTSDGVYVYGDNITINVKFSESVKVDTFEGIPKLKLETGFVDSYATYSSGSGTNTVSFIYTVGAEDGSTDLDYSSATSLSLNGGSISDSSHNLANLALPSPGASGSIGANKALVIGGWSQPAYVKAANNDVDDHFGYSVALSGDTLAVGAWQEDSNQTMITNGTTASSDDSNADSGAVYVYKRTGTSWAQEAYVKAANNGAYDLFGQSVALDGDTLAVGTISEDSSQTTITNGTSGSSNNSNDGSGAVYVYKRTGTSWAQEAYVKAANNQMVYARDGDWFGYSVALSGDTLVVGATQEDSNQTTITNGTSASSNYSNDGSGAVYVYQFQ